jgi:hypothetical protein
MRALQVILTVLGFATIFAVLMVSSAIITATIHKAIAAAPIGAIRQLVDPRISVLHPQKSDHSRSRQDEGHHRPQKGSASSLSFATRAVTSPLSV